MHDPRLRAALLIPPLIPALVYFALVAVLASVTPSAPGISLGVYLLWLVGVAYVLMFLIWLPLFLALRRRGQNDYRRLVLSAAAIFFAVALIVTGFRPQMLAFSIFSAMGGVVFGYLFCKIAGPRNVLGA
jgi:hypothetical protein